MPNLIDDSKIASYDRSVNLVLARDISRSNTKLNLVE